MQTATVPICCSCFFSGAAAVQRSTATLTNDECFRLAKLSYPDNGAKALVEDDEWQQCAMACTGGVLRAAFLRTTGDLWALPSSYYYYFAVYDWSWRRGSPFCCFGSGGGAKLVQIATH